MREPKWFNGPYHIRSQSSEGLLLEKNPYFWGKERSFFEQIEINWIDDPAGIYQAFREGKIDWIGDPLSSLSPPSMETLDKEGELIKREVTRRFVLHYNTQLFHLSCAKIRQALSAAINREEISKLFPYSRPLSDTHIFHTQNPKVLFEDGLEELGITREQFPILTFSYSHHTERKQLGLYLKKKWEEVLGVTVALDQIEWNLFRTKLERGEFEIIPTIHETLDRAPLEFLDRFEGSTSWNFSQWRCESYREILTQAHTALTSDAKLGSLARAEHILNEEMPFTPLFKCTHLFAHSTGLCDYFLDSEGCIDFSQAHFTH